MKNSKNQKRIWTKAELTIAYYIAKWNYNGLGIEKEDLVESVIGNTTLTSLNLQVANFRHVLGIPGFQKSHASAAMYELVDELANETMTNIRKIVLDQIEAAGIKIERAQIKRANKKINKKRDKLNSQSQTNFENQMKLRRQLGQRLIPIKK